MTFVDPPPPAIGEVAFKWTNNGPSGPSPAPLGLRLMTVGLTAMGGLLVGLIGFFVVGGILQHQHHEVQAVWFLYSLAGGILAGVVVGTLLAMRPAKVSTLYVGKLGCADFSGGKVRLLEFRDVEDVRSNISVMTYKGIRTEAREIYVKQDGRERLYLVSTVKGDDPQHQYCEAVLSAYAHQKAQRA